MSAAGRPLLAARTSSGEVSKDGGNTSPGGNRPPGGRPKRTLIESACSACRRRKSRCDGVRPTCSRCQNLRTDCHYEAEEGESRWSALRRRNQILEAERDQIRELMSFVQSRNESEAMDLFQRIRGSSYDDLFLLLRQIKEGALGIPPNMTPASLPPPGSADHRLPGIHSILDAPSRGMTPINLVHSQSLSSEESRTSSTSGPSGPHAHRILEPPIEPMLQHQGHQAHQAHQAPQVPHMMSGTPITYSSEESTGSMGSTSIDGPRPLIDPELLPGPYGHNQAMATAVAATSLHIPQHQPLPRRTLQHSPVEEGRSRKIAKTCGTDAGTPKRERIGGPVQEVPDA